LTLKIFFEPLLDSQLLSPSIAGKIFYGIDVLFQYHSKFYDKVNSRLKEFSDQNNTAKSILVGDLFWSKEVMIPCNFDVTKTDYFAIYSDYVNNYNAAMNLLKEQMENSDFAAFLVKCEKDPRCNFADVGDFLIQPIQRMPRYQLLLKDLLRSTPNGHPDHDNVLKALAKMEGVNKFINEKKREFESLIQVQNLQKRFIGVKIPVRAQSSLTFFRN
jgi:hypothetical protein